MAEGFEGVGEAVSKRTLKVFWLVDASGSMQGEKIATLNRAIKECIPDMRDIADENPEVEMKVNVIKFDMDASWITRDVNIMNFTWSDVTANGYTALGAALRLCLDELSVEKMGKRGLPPLIILMSDGAATDDYKTPLETLQKDRWGKRAIRIAIAIGEDYDAKMLNEFREPKEGEILVAKTAKQLVNLIRWASVTVSNTITQTNAQTGTLPPPPQNNTIQLGADNDDDDTF